MPKMNLQRILYLDCTVKFDTTFEYMYLAKCPRLSNELL